MKKYLFLSILPLACLTAHGQQRVFELPLDSSELYSTQALPVYDPASNTFVLTLSTRYRLHRFAFPAGDTTIHGADRSVDTLIVDRADRKTSLLPQFEHYLDAMTLPDGLEEAFASGPGIRFYRTVYHHNAPGQTDSIVLAPGQRLFAAFYQSGRFYALAGNKGTDQVTIWQHRPGEGITQIAKTVAVRDWGKIGHHQKLTQKRHIDDLTDLLEEVTLVSHDPAGYPPLLATLGHARLYLGAGRVYLSFDNTRLRTHVVDLPLDDRPARILEFDPAAWYGKEPPPGFSNGNSFILDSTLIVAAIVHLQFYLAFYDLTTGKLRTAYPPDANGQPAFAHSAAWQVGDFWKKDHVHRIPMAELYKNSFDYWTLGVTAGRFGDKFELQIGTVYDRESFGKFMLAFASMSVAAAGFIPTIFYAGPGSGSANTMFFKAHFERDRQQPIPYPSFKDKSQLIDTFAVAQKMARNGGFLLDYAGDYWYGYIDLWEQKYIICKF